MTSDHLIEVGNAIGIDLSTQPEYHWLVDSASKCVLPADWREFQDDHGRTAFYHPKLKQVRADHPMLGRFRELYLSHEAFKRSRGIPGGILNVDELDHSIPLLLNESFNRANRELPPVTPEIVEKLAYLLSIDTRKDFELTAALKRALDVFVDTHFESVIGANPESFINSVRDAQIELTVCDRKEEVVMCNECENHSASLKCEQCKDFFCKNCFATTHAAGKRKSHSTLWVEQAVCGSCDCMHAEIIVGDSQFFCKNCFENESRSNSEIKKIPRKIIQGVNCQECPKKKSADLICENCQDLFCYECFFQTHRRGGRARHVQLSIDSGRVWRGGVCLHIEEAQNLIDKCLGQTTPWLAFKDDRLDSYWFNFRDKVRSHQSPFLNH